MTDSLPLFVFGTLRSGMCNHHLIHGRYDRRLQARLFGYRRAAPLMIEPAPHDCVEGELFFLTPEITPEVMADCDELEGIPVGEIRGPHYERVEVTVETPAGDFQAWAYVKPR